MIKEIGKGDSIFNQFLSELRDEQIQSDRLRFRTNMHRIGQIFAYEISKALTYESRDVTTSLGAAVTRVPKHFPVLATILRAGLPLHEGLLSYFDQSDSAFVSAYRKHSRKEGDFHIEVEYLSCPDLEGAELILSDPMLATGQSMALVHQALMTKGKPAHTHVVALLASEEGLAHVKKHLPAQTTYWIGAIDDELTAQAYIVPGLGDAGDLAYGKK